MAPAISRMRRLASARDPDWDVEQAVSQTPGHYRGRHLTEWVENVTGLMREGRLEEAFDLLSHLIDATEAEAEANNWGVAPWYYEQAAIAYRNLGDKASEIAVLERFEVQPKARGVKPAKLAARLAKLRA